MYQQKRKKCRIAWTTWHTRDHQPKRFDQLEVGGRIQACRVQLGHMQGQRVVIYIWTRDVSFNWLSMVGSLGTCTLYTKHIWYKVKGWGDVTSRNDVSPYECSGTPVPPTIRPLWHNVPVLIHPCHFYHIYVLYHAYNDRDVSIQGHCVSGTIDLGDQGSQTFVRGHIVSGRLVTPPGKGPL